MLLQTTPLAIPTKAAVGNNFGVPSGILGELVVSELLGKYSNLVKAGLVYVAHAIVTAPVIYSTAAGTGGPLLWNRPSSGIDAHLLAMGFSSSIVTTVAGGVGITGAGGQSNAPGTTTVIDSTGNCLIGGPASACTTYRIGTVTNPGAQFMPVAQFHTGALTVDTTGLTWIPLDGIFIVPPGSWASPAGSATLTTLVLNIGLIWAEIPS